MLLDSRADKSDINPKRLRTTGLSAGADPERLFGGGEGRANHKQNRTDYTILVITHNIVGTKNKTFENFKILCLARK